MMATTLTEAQPQQGRENAPRAARSGAQETRIRQRSGDRLNLTADQEKQLAKLRLDSQKKMARIQSGIRLLQLDIKELWMNEKPDRAAIEKKMREISDLRHQAKVNQLDRHFAVMGVLTPEQQKIWKESRRGRQGDGECRTGTGRRGMRHRGMVQPGGAGPWGLFDDDAIEVPDMADFTDPLPPDGPEVPDTPPAPPEE
jgi:Spy/CpxP family protein refolding chaperone